MLASLTYIDSRLSEYQPIESNAMSKSEVDTVLIKQSVKSSQRQLYIIHKVLGTVVTL